MQNFEIFVKIIENFALKNFKYFNYKLEIISANLFLNIVVLLINVKLLEKTLIY